MRPDFTKRRFAAPVEAGRGSGLHKRRFPYTPTARGQPIDYSCHIASDMTPNVNARDMNLSRGPHVQELTSRLDHPPEDGSLRLSGSPAPSLLAPAPGCPLPLRQMAASLRPRVRPSGGGLHEKAPPPTLEPLIARLLPVKPSRSPNIGGIEITDLVQARSIIELQEAIGAL
jgi:hypothetical protein